MNIDQSAIRYILLELIESFFSNFKLLAENQKIFPPPQKKKKLTNKVGLMQVSWGWHLC